MAWLYIIYTEVPALGDSLSWDTKLIVCDITTMEATTRAGQAFLSWVLNSAQWLSQKHQQQEKQNCLRRNLSMVIAMVIGVDFGRLEQCISLDCPKEAPKEAFQLSLRHSIRCVLGFDFQSRSVSDAQSNGRSVRPRCCVAAAVGGAGNWQGDNEPRTQCLSSRCFVFAKFWCEQETGTVLIFVPCNLIRLRIEICKEWPRGNPISKKLITKEFLKKFAADEVVLPLIAETTQLEQGSRQFACEIWPKEDWQEKEAKEKSTHWWVGEGVRWKESQAGRRRWPRWKHFSDTSGEQNSKHASSMQKLLSINTKEHSVWFAETCDVATVATSHKKGETKRPRRDRKKRDSTQEARTIFVGNLPNEITKKVRVGGQVSGNIGCFNQKRPYNSKCAFSVFFTTGCEQNISRVRGNRVCSLSKCSKFSVSHVLEVSDWLSAPQKFVWRSYWCSCCTRFHVRVFQAPANAKLPKKATVIK